MRGTGLHRMVYRMRSSASLGMISAVAATQKNRPNTRMAPYAEFFSRTSSLIPPVSGPSTSLSRKELRASRARANSPRKRNTFMRTSCVKVVPAITAMRPGEGI